MSAGGTKRHSTIGSAYRLHDFWGAIYNHRFSEDDLASLRQGLEQRFDTVEIETVGCVAVFRAA
jgi:hypothetical protein